MTYPKCVHCQRLVSWAVEIGDFLHLDGDYFCDAPERTHAEQAPVPGGCSGSEKHRHLRLADGRYVWHSHPHVSHVGDVSKLHHHPPRDHGGLSLEQLTRDEEVRAS